MSLEDIRVYELKPCPKCGSDNTDRSFHIGSGVCDHCEPMPTTHRPIDEAEIAARLLVLQGYRNDPEVQHAMLDDLWERVLRQIASGIPSSDAQALAKAAVEALSHVPERWYA